MGTPNLHPIPDPFCGARLFRHYVHEGSSWECRVSGRNAVVYGVFDGPPRVLLLTLDTGRRSLRALDDFLGQYKKLRAPNPRADQAMMQMWDMDIPRPLDWADRGG